MIKSSFYVLLFGILIASLVLPVVALGVAIPEAISGCKLVEAITYNGVDYAAKALITETNNEANWGAICALNTLNIVLNWIFIGLMTLVIIMVFVGAYNLMTAGGEAEKVTTGRKTIMYAAVGLIIALLARALPSLIRSIFGS